ncbi:MAG: hypothetical protein V7608_1062 [Hyphomicrobiales bacterium]
MMLGPFQVLFWIAEHWWILALAAAAVLALTLWTGVVQLAAMVIALAKIAAAVARFFATPADQIAAKILFGFCVAVLALSAGFYHGKHVANAAWERREVARAAALEKLRAEAERAAQQMVTESRTAEDADAAAAQQRINDYARTLPKIPDQCRITAADLVAAGVPDAQRRSHGSDPGRLQQAARSRGARQSR